MRSQGKMAKLIFTLPSTTPLLPLSTPKQLPVSIPKTLTSTPLLTLKPQHVPTRLRLTPLSAASEATDFESLGELDDGSPWQGALVYRRDASVSHIEYCTTLERLGLGNLSSDLSRARASEMGLKVVARRGAVDPEIEGGTPVAVSVDVTKMKGKLRLDGIVRTVITLGCNRCGGPAAESIFSNFTFLLTNEPIEESDTSNMGTIFGEDLSKAFLNDSDEEDDEKFIDPEDLFYFPAEEREVDISKNIRDLVHVEITINAICDPGCKGLCLQCGINLNKSGCNCEMKQKQSKFGPLKNMKKQMQNM